MTLGAEVHMRQRVADFIAQHDLLRAGASAVVGVSGGADSVALLHMLTALAPSMGFTVCAAHFNHGIRGAAADADEAFVQRLCARLGVPLFCGRADVPSLAESRGQTLEQAAREARYAFLEEARVHFGADVIAVAHHMDDQAETLLLHLARGAGLAGLVGMKPRRGRVIRPLLPLRRSEIEAYLSQEGLSFCTDETNLLRDSTRNRIRLDVLPYLAEHVNPAIVPALCAASELLAQDEAYLCEAAGQRLLSVQRGENAYDRAALAALPPALLGRAVRMALAAAGAEKDIERTHVEQVIALLQGRTGARLYLPGVDVWVDYALLCVGRLPEEAPEPFEVPLVRAGETRTEKGVFLAEEVPPERFVRDPFIACFDLAKLPAEGLSVRSRRPGDRFFPLNAPGRRKLKEFFIDRKVPRAEREVPLIACGQEILFVPGFSVADTVKVDAKTARILRVTYIPRTDAE